MTCPTFNTVACLCLVAGILSDVMASRRLCGRALADTLDLVCAGRGFNLGKRNGRSIGAIYGRRTNEINLPHVDKLVRNESSDDKDKDRDAQADMSNGVQSQTHRSDIADSSSVNGNNNNNNNNNNKSNNNNGLIKNNNDNSGVVETNDGISGPLGQALVARQKRSHQERSIVDECCLRACTFYTLESYCAAVDDPVIELPLEELRRRLGFTTRRPTPRPTTATTARYRPMGFRRPSAELVRNQGNGARRPGRFFYVFVGDQATRSPLFQ